MSGQRAQPQSLTRLPHPLCSAQVASLGSGTELGCRDIGSDGKHVLGAGKKDPSWVEGISRKGWGHTGWRAQPRTDWAQTGDRLGTQAGPGTGMEVLGSGQPGQQEQRQAETQGPAGDRTLGRSSFLWLGPGWDRYGPSPRRSAPSSWLSTWRLAGGDPRTVPGLGYKRGNEPAQGPERGFSGLGPPKLLLRAGVSPGMPGPYPHAAPTFAPFSPHLLVFFTTLRPTRPSHSPLWEGGWGERP